MSPARGFAYLALLFLIVLLGVGLAAGGVVWELRARREKEIELRFIGAQFRQAIDAYYEASPTAAKQYPKRIEDLLEDRRFPIPKRYLRRIYRDPFSYKPEWGLIVVQNQLVGIYSRSPGVPVKHNGFSPLDGTFIGARSYEDWRFLAVNLAGSPPVPALDPAAAPRPAGPQRLLAAPSR
jgi:type II secretory pathway pseudopilin PulG